MNTEDDDLCDAMARAAIVAYRRVKGSGPQVALLEDQMAGSKQTYPCTARVESAAVIARDGRPLEIGLVLTDGSVVPLSFDQALRLRVSIKDWGKAFVSCIDPAFAKHMEQLDAARGWTYEGPTESTREPL